MRPKRLTIEGLHSFKEKQQIDFEGLMEAGLFGIFGPTGSGKSTILDAITLALYGSVGRANKGTQGICNAHSEQVEVSFTFEIGAGAERKVYKVERSFKPQKDNPTFVNAKKSRLIQILGEEECILADKPSEINKKIEEDILGIKMDDFTRSVVLPQGKFSEFLSLTGGQRRDMLERIFNLEKYGRRLFASLKSKMDGVKDNIARIEGAMASLGECTLEQVQQLEQEVLLAKQQELDLIKELEKLEKEHESGKEVWELQKQYEQLQQTEKMLYSQFEQIQLRKKELNLSYQAEGFRFYMEQQQSLQNNLEKAKEEQQQIEAQHRTEEQRLGDAKRQYEEVLKRKELEQPKLFAQKANLETAMQLQTELEEIANKHKQLQEQYKQKKQEQDRLEGLIQQNKQQKQDIEVQKKQTEEKIKNAMVSAERKLQVQQAVVLEKEYLRMEKEVEEAVCKLNAQEMQCKKLKQAAEALEKEKKSHIDAVEKPIEQDRISEAKEKIQHQQNVIQWIEEKSKELHAHIVELQQVEKSIERVSESIASKQKDSIVLEERVAEFQQEWDALEKKAKELQQRNAAGQLARGLEENTPCPVCGALHHPDLAEALKTDELEGYEAKRMQLTNELEECKKQQDPLKEILINEMAKQRMLMEQKEKLEKDVEKQQQWIAEKYLGLESNLQALDLEEAKVVLHRERERVTQSEVLWSLLNELQKKQDQLQASLAVQQQHLLEMQESFSQMKNQLGHSKNAYEDTLAALDMENAEQEQKHIYALEKQVEAAQQKIQEYSLSLENVQIQSEKLTAQREQLQKTITEMITEGKAYKENKEEKEKKIFEIAGTASVKEQHQKIELELKNIAQTEEKNKQEFEVLQTGFIKISERKVQLSHQVEILLGDVRQNQKSLEKLLVEKEFASIEEGIKALRSEEDRKQLENGIQEYEKHWSMVMEAKKQLEKRLQGRSLTDEQWTEIQASLHMKKEMKNQLLERRATLEAQYKESMERYGKIEELEKQQQKHLHRQGLFLQLQNLFKGNAFVEFIAEEHLNYIAKEASDRLGKLTKHRYALEIDHEGSFVMRDDANGGIRRPVSSLSGGETFLTSLSLALALSSQIQLNGKYPLEFFFLDEGFGTLDANLLDVVLGALERLHYEKMSIGVISHVNEMRERIGRRLMVTPSETGGQGSRLYIEKA